MTALAAPVVDRLEVELAEPLPATPGAALARTGAEVPSAASVVHGRVFAVLAHRHPDGATGLEDEMLQDLVARALAGVAPSSRGRGVAVLAVVLPGQDVDPGSELAAAAGSVDNSVIVAGAWPLT